MSEQSQSVYKQSTHPCTVIISHRSITQDGDRRDVYLGARECQAYIEPCVFGEGEGFYDDTPELSFGLMYHGMTYPDEAYSEETQGHLSVRFWMPVMKRGVIEFTKPEDCRITRVIREMDIKPFGEDLGNFSGLREFGEVD